MLFCLAKFLDCWSGADEGLGCCSRGIYCMLVCATLLDILTPELVQGTAAFLKK